MASESQAPPPPGSGGNAKYIVLTLLLFGGAAAMWFALNKEDPPPAAPAPAVADAGPATPPPPEGLDIEIPPEEPDMGPGEDLGPPTKRIVYRYVGGGGGGWDCSGEVANARSVMAEARRQVQNCYERQLKTNNTLQGTVTLSVKVGASGSVAATQVGGTLRDNEVFACVRNLAQSLHFSPPVGGSCAVVQQPFTLSPRN